MHLSSCAALALKPCFLDHNAVCSFSSWLHHSMYVKRYGHRLVVRPSLKTLNQGHSSPHSPFYLQIISVLA